MSELCKLCYRLGRFVDRERTDTDPVFLVFLLYLVFGVSLSKAFTLNLILLTLYHQLKPLVLGFTDLSTVDESDIDYAISFFPVITTRKSICEASFTCVLYLVILYLL